MPPPDPGVWDLRPGIPAHDRKALDRDARIEHATGIFAADRRRLRGESGVGKAARSAWRHGQVVIGVGFSAESEQTSTVIAAGSIAGKHSVFAAQPEIPYPRDRILRQWRRRVGAALARNMPPVDFCPAARPPFDGLSRRSDTRCDDCHHDSACSAEPVLTDPPCTAGGLA